MKLDEAIQTTLDFIAAKVEEGKQCSTPLALSLALPDNLSYIFPRVLYSHRYARGATLLLLFRHWPSNQKGICERK